MSKKALERDAVKVDPKHNQSAEVIYVELKT